MKMKMKIDFNECERRCKVLAREIKRHKNIKFLYPVKRGGMAICLRLSHLTGIPITYIPSIYRFHNTAIIDDCVDSGLTKEKFKNYKYFYVLVDKQKEKIKDWLVYWWEEK